MSAPQPPAPTLRSGDESGLVLKVSDVVVVAGGFPALTGADVAVERGEIVCLAGPNGSGKTTLLRACAGLVPATSGTVEVFGLELGPRQRHLRAGVGYLGHGSGLFDALTPRENLRFWARACGVDDPDVDAALDATGVPPRVRSTQCRLLSAGQQRRVGLAGVVVRRPGLWLLDEPHASLDTDGMDRCDGLIQRAAAAGAAVVFSSHDAERSQRLADRIVNLRGGTTRLDPSTESPGPVATSAS